MTTILISLCCYLLGSIPFGFLITKARGIDVRTIGSGNIGATNIARALGTKWFLPVFLLDASKGFLAVYLPKTLLKIDDYRLLLFAASSIFGHMTTPFLKFKGGKGVATGFGAIVAIDYISAIVALTIFLISLLATRFVSLSSCLACIGLSAYFCLHKGFSGANLPFTISIIAISAVVIYKHRNNIRRIIDGTEPKIMHKK